MEKLYETIDEKKLGRRKDILKDKKKEGKDLGDLYAMEIALEDNISTRGIKTKLGSKMLENYIPPFDAEVVRRLEDGDALIRGKIDTREFGVGEEIDSKMGQVVKEGEAQASLGIDACGEIRKLAAASNLYGLKPTYGSVSRYGVIGSAPSLEQVGVIAEDIETVKRVFHTICGKDKKDSTSLEIEKVQAKDLKDLKIGVIEEHIEDGNGNRNIKIERSIKKLEELGVEIDYVSIPSVKYIESTYNILQSAEFSSDMGKFDGLVYGYTSGEHKDNEDFFRRNRTEGFSERVKKKIMFGNFVLREENYKKYYEKSQRIRTLISEEVKNVFKDHHIILNTIGKDIESTALVNLVGLPALSLPSLDEDVKLQIMGAKFSEETLFKFAKAYEDKFLSDREEEGE